MAGSAHARGRNLPSGAGRFADLVLAAVHRHVRDDAVPDKVDAVGDGEVTLHRRGVDDRVGGRPHFRISDEEAVEL